MANDHSADYQNVTETPDTKGSREQIARLFSRYRFAADFCKDKTVVEVACGAGVGLGYLARVAKKVVGGDIDENNLYFARTTYAGRGNIEIRTFDAHRLPFGDNSVDVVLLYEAIYYLSQPELFIREAYRILRRDGTLIICSVNKEWDEFNPSPYSHKYYSSLELYSMLTSNYFATTLYGESLVRKDGLRNKVLGLLKKGAVKYHLIPKTMKGKELLKRLFFGKLRPIPSELYDGLAAYYPPASIPFSIPVHNYKVIFAVGKKQ